ncbi:GDP-L-fucose synthase family protein [Mongoliitalea lutea]|uniref:GDP-L-fucose synthase n=1 Tax=Mongoliitalea lutea TaxID=849756 RepID=A0A8J3CWR7_9BACT|nr:GDP-L-fucose synthase [Mongoliitalea lutea]GHB37265.1 GDP-L-fucose synthase [Mongoliitalea lutea]
MHKNALIYVAGGNGMVGSAILRLLSRKGYSNLLTMPSSELDLRNQVAVDDFFNINKPSIVIDAAARVGGILANQQYPYQFLMDNLKIQNNLIDASVTYEVEKFIFLGSSCIYPKFANQPLREEYLLTSALEPTNEWYALAKIAGIKACEAARIQYGKDFLSLMPTNLYGPNDNFDLKTSHVLPAMIRKFHEAKVRSEDLRMSNPKHIERVELWGSGTPMREFLHVDDLADAVVFALENSLEDHLYNVGTGVDLSIRELASMIQSIVGFEGDIVWDDNKPDGTPRKLMDVSKMTQAGWKAKLGLEEGIRSTYDWFLENQNSFKEVKI